MKTILYAARPLGTEPKPSSREQRCGGETTRSGYSIGIAYAPDWGEGHILSLQPDDPGMLEENMTFHLIPWIQIPGKAGIGLSETVRVTPAGAESFFTLDRKLFVK